MTKMKIEFAPGCFDSFEGTQEELEALKTEIAEMFENEEVLKDARQLTEEEEEELFHMLMVQELNNKRQ